MKIEFTEEELRTLKKAVGLLCMNLEESKAPDAPERLEKAEEMYEKLYTAIKSIN